MLCAIPIETKIREFDGVLYLAFHLAKKGLVSLIGERLVGRIVHDSNKLVLYFDNDHIIGDNTSILESGDSGHVFESSNRDDSVLAACPKKRIWI
ncbi:MAG: hypothetical protein JEY79_18495 [Pseudodesulfovibrio sp.]|nr:hypothetical protein [Pseudodesulfovibrio sp.]